MKNSQTPTFSSPELQKVVAAAKPVLEGVEEARNRVSNDIKALETYLQSLDLKTSFRHPTGECFFPEDDRVAAAALEYSGSASGEIREEALVWSEDKGSFRLLYEVSCWDGSVEVDSPGGPLFRDDNTLRREAKPLIETKFEVRKRMYQHLPNFVAHLAKHLDVGRKFQLDDVPF